MSYLSAPILPQAVNGVLDKSKITDNKIIVEIPKYEGIAEKDQITLHFTSVPHVYSVPNPESLKDPFQIAQIDISQFPDGEYQLYYFIRHFTDSETRSSNITSVKVIDGTSSPTTTPPNPSDGEPFIVMGARYSDLVIANGLKAPQRLTAWDKNGNPLSVKWEYIGGKSPLFSPFSYESSSFFYDTAPWLAIKVTHGTDTLKISPINVIGNGGTLGLPVGAYNDPIDHEYDYLAPSPSSFAVLLNDNTMVGWGGVFGNYFTQSGIKSITTTGDSYAGLKTDSTLWAYGTNMRIPPGNFDDVAAGGRSFFAVEKGTRKIFAWEGAWGENSASGYYPYDSLGDGKNLFVGNLLGCTAYNSHSGKIQTLWGTAIHSYGWVLDPNAPYLVSPPRFLTAMPRGFALADPNGNLSIWGDLSLFQPFSPSSQDLICTTGLSYRGEKEFEPLEPLGNVAIRRDGSVYVWGWTLGNGYYSINGNDHEPATDLSSTRKAILVLRGNKLSTYSAEGVDALGGDILNLTDIVQITGSANGFAVLRKNGQVATWQHPDSYNIPSIAQPDMKDIRAIYSTGTAFLALSADNKVYTWGGIAGGGSSSEVQSLLNGKLTYYMD
ncbi:conserved protein of unknown function [Xenorhabdus poinarii G6]|uniref:Uncharacterized protein n=1 Tax=Xenorhabdus poinarii G6 TaxID=1354304 RepID=A0A068QY12_9GAMM|nr:hypothetical protein [Xenorhabdus poinarii]CDG19818.1 conserved protein of unknown function [Xenorhabdus poinarii G6]